MLKVQWPDILRDPRYAKGQLIIAGQCDNVAEVTGIQESPLQVVITARRIRTGIPDETITFIADRLHSPTGVLGEMITVSAANGTMANLYPKGCSMVPHGAGRRRLSAVPTYD